MSKRFRHIGFIISGLLILGFQNAHAQKKTDVEEQKPVQQEDKGKFERTNKSWAVGIRGGYAQVNGDISSTGGYTYGLGVRRALGNSFSLRVQYDRGTTYGLDYHGTPGTSLQFNNAVNGNSGAAKNYYSGGERYFGNYRTSFNSVQFQGILNLNNINFEIEEPKWNFYLLGGVGIMLYNPTIDALDANGNRYKYSSLGDVNKGASSSDVKSQVKNLLDGNYESTGDIDPGSPTLLGNYYTLAISGGVGIERKLSQKFSIAAEANYFVTNSRQLDGSRINNSGAISGSDGFFVATIGLNYRLGNTENTYWFSNPVRLSSNSLMNSKKSMMVVNKDVQNNNELREKVDQIFMGLTAIQTDNDSDGVSDYFDKEPNTPHTAIVDGAGRTIFFRDEDDNLVFSDPNKTGAGGNSKFDPQGTGYSSAANGSPVKKLNDGRIYEKAPDGAQVETVSGGKKFRKAASGKTYAVKQDGSEQEFDLNEPSEGGAKSFRDKFGNTIKTFPSGLRYKTTKDGTVFKTYPDGTTYKKTPEGRIYLVGNDISNDGEVDFLEKAPKGTTFRTDEEGTKYQQYPDGTRIKTASDGSIYKTYPDGSTYLRTPDGRVTRIKTDKETGEQELDFRDAEPNPRPSGSQKTAFNAGDRNNKTVFQKNGSANSLNQSSTAGVNSAIGFLPAIFFDTDKFNVKQNYYPELFMVAEALRTHPEVRMKVIGHCDTRSSEEHNQVLGMNRAKTVVYVLNRYFGVPEGQLITETKGEVDPLVNMDNIDALAANRRVQFEVVSGNLYTAPNSQNQKKLRSATSAPEGGMYSPVDKSTPLPDPKAK